MNLTPEEAATFVNVGWMQGLRMVGDRQAQSALKELTMPATVNPDAIARAQTAYAIWHKEIASIIQGVNDFLREGENKAVDIKTNT